MTHNEILENLCMYDERNPANILGMLDDTPTDGRGQCYCDNCFYGRTGLAEEILKLK